MSTQFTFPGTGSSFQFRVNNGLSGVSGSATGFAGLTASQVLTHLGGDPAKAQVDVRRYVTGNTQARVSVNRPEGGGWDASQTIQADDYVIVTVSKAAGAWAKIRNFFHRSR